MTNLDYLYNPDAAKERFSKSYFSDQKLGFQVIEHGMILPYKDTDNSKSLRGALGGIVDNNDKFISNSFVYEPATNKNYIPPESIQHSSETVVYLGYFIHVWGHFISDNMRHLWFLKSDAFKNEFKNCPLVCIEFDKRNITQQQNFKRMLEILEVDIDRLRPIKQPTQFEKIIIPQGSFSPSKGFTNEYRETMDIIRHFAIKNCTPILKQKIYYFHGRNQYGEERLAEYFKSKGYEIVRPERLTLDEQLNILINCESFASTLGSCAHNSVFLRDNTEAIFIPRSGKRMVSHQLIIDQLRLLNVNYIDSTFSVFHKSVGPYCYVISEQLKRFFGDKWNDYEEEDFKTFLKYVKNSISTGLAVNPSAEEYYAPILEDFMTQLKQREDLIAAYDMPTHWEEFRQTLTYQTHIHTKGWSTWQSEEQINGFLEDKLDIQAIKINFPNHKVYYSVYYNEQEGWSEEVASPEMAGTTGKSKPINGVRIMLDETGTKQFDILYRVHKFDGEWTDWAKNGEAIYSYGVKLNAIQIKMERKQDVTK